MKWLFFICCLSVSVMGYGRSPFQLFDPSALHVSMGYYGGWSTDGSPASSLGTLQGVVRFNTLFFGVSSRIQPNQRSSVPLILGWVPLDRASLGPVKWSAQLGAYAVGVPAVANDPTSFLPEYALSHKVYWGASPLRTIITQYLSSNGRGNYGIVFALEHQHQQAFLEYDAWSTSVYAGVSSRVINTTSVVVAANMSRLTTSHRDDDRASPMVTIQLRVADIFSTHQPPPNRRPLPVNDAALTQLETALLAYHQGDYVASGQLYRQLTQSYPRFTLAYIRLGNCYYQLKQYEMAKTAWATALSLDPQNDAVFMALIQLQNRTHQIKALGLPSMAN
jgi:tetratricopeptide (TPR) repeat protein